MDSTAEQSGGERRRDAKKSPPLPLVLAGAFVGAIFALVLAAWAGDSAGYASTHQMTDDAKVDADTVFITSKIGERVDGVFTDANLVVHRGQLLVELDSRDERTRLDQAIAARDAQQAQYLQAEQTVRLTRDQVATETESNRGTIDQTRSQIQNAADTFDASREQIGASLAAVAQAQDQYRSARAAVPGAKQQTVRTGLDLARDSALLRTGDVAQSDVDADRAAYVAAVSSYRESLAAVAASRANVADAKQQARAQQAQSLATGATIDANRGALVNAQGRYAEARTPYRISTQEAALEFAERNVKQGDAAVRFARDQVGYTRIYAPCDGVVAEKSLAVGQTIGIGETLLTIVPADDAYVTANFKETQLDRMRVGQPVDIHVDAYPEFAFVGHVGGFNPASQNEFAAIPAQNSSGNFVKVINRVPVRIYIDGGGTRAYPLRPGMSAETSVRVR